MGDSAFQSYRDLRVWQEAMALAELCYRHTRDFPREELFGLTTQIRRAAASIPANIAEGWGRESTGAYLQFLRIAQGSCKELETHASSPSASLRAVRTLRRSSRVRDGGKDAARLDPFAPAGAMTPQLAIWRLGDFAKDTFRLEENRRCGAG
jgi:four helix bundle protein